MICVAECTSRPLFNAQIEMERGEIDPAPKKLRSKCQAMINLVGKLFVGILMHIRLVEYYHVLPLTSLLAYTP